MREGGSGKGERAKRVIEGGRQREKETVETGRSGFHSGLQLLRVLVADRCPLQQM